MPDKKTNFMRTVMLVVSVAAVLLANPIAAGIGLVSPYSLIFYGLIFIGFFVGFGQRDRGRYIHALVASLLPYAALPVLVLIAGAVG